MSVSLWQCDHDGCKFVAHGSGPARGLRAIGWTVIEGGPFPLTYCPDHPSDPNECAHGIAAGIECRACYSIRTATDLIPSRFCPKCPGVSFRFGLRSYYPLAGPPKVRCPICDEEYSYEQLSEDEAPLRPNEVPGTLRVSSVAVSARPKCACCARGDEYNGFRGPPPKLFECPKSCGCHD